MENLPISTPLTLEEAMAELSAGVKIPIKNAKSINEITGRKKPKTPTSDGDEDAMQDFFDAVVIHDVRNRNQSEPARKSPPAEDDPYGFIDELDLESL